MIMRFCLLHEEEPCIECGECDRCDLDENKICDNCCKCIDSEADFKEIEIDSIELEDELEGETAAERKGE